MFQLPHAKLFDGCIGIRAKREYQTRLVRPRSPAWTQAAVLQPVQIVALDDVACGESRRKRTQELRILHHRRLQHASSMPRRSVPPSGGTRRSQARQRCSGRAGQTGNATRTRLRKSGRKGSSFGP